MIMTTRKTTIAGFASKNIVMVSPNHNVNIRKRESRRSNNDKTNYITMPQSKHGDSMTRFAARLISSSETVIARAGDKVMVWAEFMNTGTGTWDSDVRIGTDKPIDHSSIFVNEDWLAPGRPVVVSGEVLQGQSTRLQFTINIPKDCEDGKYEEHFSLVREGITWFHQPESKWTLNVHVGDIAPKDTSIANYNKICFLSTWGIKCGISQYCKNLFDALTLRDYKVKVMHHETDHTEIYNHIINHNYGIFIVQFEMAIIPNINSLLHCITRLKNHNSRIKIYFIIHSENNALTSFNGKIDGFIYHKQNTLVFNQTKCYIVPMGVPVFQPLGDRNFYRDKYGIGHNKFVISTLGFMFAWKKHADFLKTMLPYLQKYDDIVIQLLTSYHSINNRECIAECEKIKNVINNNGLENKVIHITEYISQEELNERLFLSDLGFLWSGIETTSSSASLKEFVSSRLPLVKTTSNHLHDVNIGCAVTDKNLDMFVIKIIELYNAKQMLPALRTELEDFYNKVNYNQTITKFLEIFNE
jgi:hypothetical protein